MSVQGKKTILLLEAKQTGGHFLFWPTVCLVLICKNTEKAEIIIFFEEKFGENVEKENTPSNPRPPKL